MKTESKKKKKKKNDNSRLPMTGVSSDRCCHFSEAAGFTEIARSQETVLASVFYFVLLWFRSLSSVISFVFTHWLGLGKGCGAEIWRVANESRIPAQEYICNPLGVRCSASWTRLRCNCVFFYKNPYSIPQKWKQTGIALLFIFLGRKIKEVLNDRLHCTGIALLGII